MKKKPTYEELEQENKKLKKEVLMLKNAENLFQDYIIATLEALRRSEEKLSAIIASVPDHMTVIDEQYNIVWANDVAKELFGPDVVSRKCYSVYHGYDKQCTSCMVSKCFENGKVRERETEVNGADRNQKFFWCTCTVIAWHSDDRPKYVIGIFRDITERKHAREVRKKNFQQLQLSYDQAIIYAEELCEQIKERKQVEKALRERKAALTAQSINLKEVNTALKVLLRHRERDKNELEEKVLANVRELILPYVRDLRNTRLGSKQMAYIGIIESNLNTIISAFAQKLSSKYLGLTFKEIQVAGLIKGGKTSKEIAELLNVSVRAVEFHRDNIRTKLGLKNKKANLTTYLLSFQ